MKRDKIVTGLDIGSSKISAVVAAIDRIGALKILAHVTQSSKGVSRGAFLDLSGTSDSVSKVLARAGNKAAVRPQGLYVSISGQTVKGSRSTGMIPLSERGREVTRSDMARCVKVAGTVHLPFDREVVHKIIRSFSVDDQPPATSAAGLYASRLNCEVYVITAGANHIQNLHKCVNNAGYDIKELVFTGIADAAAVLEKDEAGAGGLLLDIGATLTEASFFLDGTLRDLEIVPIGGDDIKDDFKDSAPLEELVSALKKKIEIFLEYGGRMDYVVLTGGASFNDGFVEFLEERLGRKLKMGAAKDVRGDISSLDSIKLTTAIGLCKYAHDKYMISMREDKGAAKTLSAKVVDIFNNYF